MQEFAKYKLHFNATLQSLTKAIKLRGSSTLQYLVQL